MDLQWDLDESDKITLASWADRAGFLFSEPLCCMPKIKIEIIRYCHKSIISSDLKTFYWQMNHEKNIYHHSTIKLKLITERACKNNSHRLFNSIFSFTHQCTRTPVFKCKVLRASSKYILFLIGISKSIR